MGINLHRLTLPEPSMDVASNGSNHTMPPTRAIQNVLHRLIARIQNGGGLRIVDELADNWGVLAGSTRVWFRLIR